MSDIMAAIGNSQLLKIDEFSQKRRKLAEVYDDYFKTNKFFTTISRNYKEVVPHIYPIVLSSKIDRSSFQEFLIKNNIQTGIHYKPNHLLDYFSSDTNLPLKNTDSIYKQIVTMPLHPDLELKRFKLYFLFYICIY